MGLKEFLVSTKISQSDLLTRPRVHIVLGNEANDIDSTVCALTYSYFLSKVRSKPGTFILPVLCIPRDKFHLRLETEFFLKRHDILSDDLTFLDDLDLGALVNHIGLTLTATLVDHHILGAMVDYLKDCIVEVIDHRPLAGDLPSTCNVLIEPVGSCATLVARRMLATEEFTMEPVVAELLLGTILTDTSNMSTSDNIATPQDHEVLVKLKNFLPPSLSATSIYDEIRNARFNLSSLTVSEMLQKDLKVLKGTQIVVAMSSITMDLMKFLQMPEFSHDATEFCRTLPADVIIIQTFVTGESGISNRWIAVYSENSVYLDQLTDVVISSTSPNLELEPLTVRVSNLNAFVQKNLQCSRKKVLPLISDFLAGKVVTPEENLNYSGQFAYSDAREMGDSCEEEARRHINLAKTFQSDQFRTSQDRFDLAAIGAEALISPSLSSDSDGVSPSGKEEESGEGQLSSQVPENLTGSGDFFMKDIKLTNKPEFVNNLIDIEDQSQEKVPDITLASEGMSSQGMFPIMNGQVHVMNSEVTSIGDSMSTEDILQHHSPYDLLCPTNVDSPLDISSMPTSGQASGQGSKVPSYPDTPPNSFMESSSGGMYYRETQLPSFNSSEMVKRIQAKKATLAGHNGSRDLKYDMTDDDDSFDVLSAGGLGGGGSSSGSLISPAVPQNSYMDLTSRYTGQLPKLTNSDILERVNEKRSQFEWNVESASALENAIPAHHLRAEPFTPQNSFKEGSFETYARDALPSLNNAEIVAKIKAKQSAMFGGSGSSDDSGDCQSPEVGGKSPRIPSPYTPQNSYRDSLQLMEARNMMPDLNEVAERLSVEQTPKPHFLVGGDTREDEHIITNHQSMAKSARHSSSQSDSQNTMSDVDSLMSVSTDVGTPSENIVASGLAGLMRNDMAMLHRRDTSDSDVFAPTRSEENFSSNNESRKLDVILKSNHTESPPKVSLANGQYQGGTQRKVGFEEKGLFSPVEESQFLGVEDHALIQTAESLVAQSVAAALQATQTDVLVGKRSSSPPASRLRWKESTVVNFIEDDCHSDDDIQCNKDYNDTEGDIADAGQGEAIDQTNSNKEELEDDVPSSSTTQDSLQLDFNLSVATINTDDHNSLEIQPDEALVEEAMRELAFEFAQDLILSVLNDFPFIAEDKCGTANDSHTTAEDQHKASTSKLNKCSSQNCSVVLRPDCQENKSDNRTIRNHFEDDIEMAMSESFPSQKLSKIEEFPFRRLSHEETLTRRASRMEEGDYESSEMSHIVETDYLPNMDPLQGNLDIIDASYSKITDVDREVVEGESFRKVSHEHLFNSKELEANNNGICHNDDEILPEHTSLKMAARSKKKIRVSFSEDFDDEVGDFNVQSSSRTHLRSPPPPLLSQDSLSSSPPSRDQLELENDAQDQPMIEKIDSQYEEEEASATSTLKAHEQVGKIIESAEETLAEIDKDLDFFTTTQSLPSPNPASPHALASNREPALTIDVRTPFVSDCSPLQPANTNLSPKQCETDQPMTRVIALPVFADPLHSHIRNLSSTSFGSIKGAEFTEEWQDDDIVEMAAQSGLDAPALDSLRKKIVPDSSCLHAIADDGIDDEDDAGVSADEDDHESDSNSGDLEWERRQLLQRQDDTPVKPPARPGIAPTIGPESAIDGVQARWKRVSVSGSQFDIDLQAIEPYRNVLSHGGYYAEGLNAIIVFYGCHLPSRRRENYAYVMNHLFHYVIHTLEELVADDYVIIYFHGSTPRRQMPGLTWLKRCYQSIDRRLKKNLKGLYLVHPTIWLKTIVTMIRPFISSKFSSKLRFVKNLEELNALVPMANITIPEAIVQLEEIMKQNPHYLEEQEEDERRQMKEEEKEKKKKDKERKKEEKDKKKQEDNEKKQNKKLEKERKKQEKEKEKEKKKEDKRNKNKP